MDWCICSSQQLDLSICSSGLLEFCTYPSRKCALAAFQTLQSSAESSCSPGASVEVHWWMASCVGPSSTSLLSNFSNLRRKQPAVEEPHLSQSWSEDSGRNLHWRDGAELLSHRVRNPETKCLTYSYMAVVDKSPVNSSRVFQHMFSHNPSYSSTLGQCQSLPPSLFLAQVQQEKCWGSSSLGEECGDHECASKPKQLERTTSRPSSLETEILISFDARWPNRDPHAQQSPWQCIGGFHQERTLYTWWWKDAANY